MMEECSHSLPASRLMERSGAFRCQEAMDKQLKQMWFAKIY
jgi:hypothetical protein